MSETIQLAIAQNTKPRVPKSDPDNNPAVTKCWRAYTRAYRKERDKKDNTYDAEKAAKMAYILAMPDLAGYENIRNFIACAGFAIIYDMITQKEGDRFLAAARLALAALDHEPKSKPGLAADGRIF